jgi:hypothetical protein
MEPMGGELFVDERGNGLRVSWHPEDDVAVVSVWRDGSCVGTVRLPGHELLRLSTMITEAWLEHARQVPEARS